MTESRGFSYLAVAWLAVTIALFTASLLVGVESAAGDKAGTNDDINLASADIQLSSAAVVYGGVRWTHLETRLVPRANDRFSRPVVVVEMIATNTTSEHEIRVRGRDLALVLDDGSRAPLSRFAHTSSTSRISLAPGTSQAVTLVFKPSIARDPLLSRLSLEIAEVKHRPAVLALGPEAESSPAFSPIAAAVDSTRDAERLGLTVTSAMVDVNAGPYRATVDEKLVIVHVQARGDATANTEFYDPDLWLLESEDDETFDSIRALWVSDQPAADATSDTIELVFALPSDHSIDRLSLGAGQGNVKIGSMATPAAAE